MLRVGVSINSCKIKANGPPEMPKHADRKAALKEKFPKVFQGLGKLKGYQLKFHIDQDIHPVAQPVLRIPFSRRDKVNEKLEDLLEFDVIIDKVEGPTSWPAKLPVPVQSNPSHCYCCLSCSITYGEKTARQATAS